MRFGIDRKIRNYETILQEIDKKLEVEKPPALEYIYVTPYPRWRDPLFGFEFGLPYGHAAVRYTTPEGEQIVMNIMKNNKGRKLVNFVDPNEYFFGVDSFYCGAEQGGIYNRTMISVRIENLPDEEIKDLHYFFKRMERLEKREKIGFNFAVGPVLNFFRTKVPFEMKWSEYGNCARWTSAGLEFAGLMEFKSMIPKNIWIRLYEEFGAKDRSNVNVVIYERSKDSAKRYGLKDYDDKSWIGGSPLSPLWNWNYFDMKSFADVHVKIPEDSDFATVERLYPTRNPSKWRYRRTEIFGSTALTAFCFYKIIKRVKFI